MRVYTMKITANGQISVPSAVRARWGSSSVTILDLDDRLVVQPSPVSPRAALVGKYASVATTADEYRLAQRAQDLHDDAQR
jgi:bifunctional DNA-binding transcriptional regulator/antitoxin component of YhaV-PrlF toxin-antitoxin module